MLSEGLIDLLKMVDLLKVVAHDHNCMILWLSHECIKCTHFNACFSSCVQANQHACVVSCRTRYLLGAAPTRPVMLRCRPRDCVFEMNDCRQNQTLYR